MVWVGVTPGAGAIGKVERDNFVCALRCTHLVAFDASHCRMSARQRKLRVAMLRDGEEGPVEVLDRVAVLATVLIWRFGELAVVRILVAIRARSVLHFVDGVLSGWNMALRALHTNVLSLERILRCRMLFHAKQRRFPPIHGVAFRTFTLLRPMLELSAVDVLVAIRTEGEGERPFEITSQVTGAAIHLGVQPEQRELCLGMVKREGWQHLLPAGRRVAFFACLLVEGPVVRVHMAGRTRRELHIPEARGTPRMVRLVTLLAGHLGVHPG